jgi:hypothetical protein
MKKLVVLALLGCCHAASAQVDQSCTSLDSSYERVNDVDQVIELLSGKRVEATAPPEAPSPGEEWNEDHCDILTSGALYKVGTTEPPPKYPDLDRSVDPRAYRGQWGLFFSGGVAVQYVYSPTTIFFWSLWKNSSDDLCWERIADSRVIAVDSAPLPADIPAALDCSNPNPTALP